ncbi:MAG: hypothetical protein M1829_000426 [Trizodia sp. TS-e1964]|nr:MAG: hypothetical protein M1829_000426 [Trizodia sp. TS-e1964]
MSNHRSAPRPKRAGELFARAHRGGSDDPSTKKPRFDVRNPSALAADAPEQDAFLELDEIGRSGQQTKRSAVNIDGYESDSDNEGFDARAAARAKDQQAKNDADDDTDMFADPDEDNEDQESKAKSKNVRFLEAQEIEGQVATSRSGVRLPSQIKLSTDGKGRGKPTDGNVSSDSDSGDDGDEQVDEEVGAGGKKKHEPRIEAFNIKGEMEEGRFDDQGNFVRKAVDPDAVHDTWLDGVSKRDMKRAKEAAEKREDERRQKSLADDQVLTSDVLSVLISQLEKGESVLEALARLGRAKEKKPKWQAKSRNKNKRTQADVVPMEVERPASEDEFREERRREAVEAITGAADQLLTRGQTDIYDETREMLIRQYRRESGEDWVEKPLASDILGGSRAAGEPLQHWEFRWIEDRSPGAANGPYERGMMVAWHNEGYFAANAVEFRRVGDTEWSRVADFL